MKFNIGSGMNRDPGYPGPRGLGALGLSRDIIDWPQTPAQWWGVGFLLTFFALPWGLWGTLFGIGLHAVITYFVMAGLAGLVGWLLRHPINEDYAQLWASMVVSAAALAGTIWLAAFYTFSNGQWFGGTVVTIIAAIAVNILFRTWQTLLVIGLFTTQERMIHPPQEFVDQVSRYRHQRQSRTSSS